MINEELINRLASQEEVYFENSFEEVAFRANPKQGYEAKRKNGKPFKVEIGNKILTDAFLESKLITKKQFENY